MDISNTDFGDYWRIQKMNSGHSLIDKSSTSLLSQQFPLLATSPNGITKLRKLILQLAIRGQLGTNDQKEKKIAIEDLKHNVRKRKTQNGEKSNIQILDTYTGYLIPLNWIKTTLGAVGLWSTGGTPSRRENQYFNGNIPWIKSGDLNDGYVKGTQETISQKGLEKSNAKILPIDTISIALYGATIGKLGILGIEAATNQACANCIVNKAVILPRFLFYYLRSQREYFIQVGQGGAQPNITNWIIWEWPVALPPLAEQHRIVEKVDRLMALCDTLEAQQRREHEQRVRYGTAAQVALQNAKDSEELEKWWGHIAENFEEIFDSLENVTALRQTILQLAVQGRLGTQDDWDESASILWEKIRDQKRILEESGVIREDKSVDLNGIGVTPFEIPFQWKWVKLGEITIITDRDHRTPKYYDSGVPLVSPVVFTRNGIDFSNVKFVDKDELRLFKAKCNPQKGDILYSRIGAIIGEARIIDFDEDFVALHSLALIKPINPFINSDFLCKFLSSQFIRDQGYKGVKSMGVPDLGLKAMKNFIFPLPPLAEQHRIVIRVNSLMELCDKLEGKIWEREASQEHFANSLVKQIIETPITTIQT